MSPQPQAKAVPSATAPTPPRGGSGQSRQRVTVMYENDEGLRTAYLNGAQAEAARRHNGMTEDNRQVYDYVRAMAQTGRPADEILRAAVYVFTATWSLSERLRLAVLVLTAGIR